MKLFVYGSLLRGMSLSSHMQGSNFLGPAYAYADMFFLGFYPGIIPGNQMVFGELYEVPLDLLPEIDNVEDYIEIDSDSSLYLRRPISVYLFSSGQKVEASAYYYNRECNDKPRIANGDYRRFMNNGKSDKTWFIGYGTNLSSAAMQSKIGGIPEHKIVQIQGYERLFNVRTGVNGFARANLSFTGSAKKIDLVAWHLTTEQFEKLDREEQVPNLYHRISMPYVEKNGEYIYAHTYMANTDRIGNNLYPEPHYIDFQEMGMREHGIS